MNEALKVAGIDKELKDIPSDDNAETRKASDNNSVFVNSNQKEIGVTYYNNSKYWSSEDVLLIQKGDLEISLDLDASCQPISIEFKKTAFDRTADIEMPIFDLVGCVSLRDRLPDGVEKDFFALACKGILQYKWAPTQVHATGLIFNDEAYKNSPRKTNQQ